MRQLTINPDNRQYYSEDFIKGFNCGAHRQFEADKSDADRPQGMWELVPCADLSEYFEGVKNGFRFKCSNCKDERKRNRPDMNYCPNCGARMKGADETYGV